jgi:hypothetical protein
MHYLAMRPQLREPCILTMLAISSIACGIILAAIPGRRAANPVVARRLAGSIFVLGFVLLGVAISHWHPE